MLNKCASEKGAESTGLILESSSFVVWVEGGFQVVECLSDDANILYISINYDYIENILFKK